MGWVGTTRPEARNDGTRVIKDSLEKMETWESDNEVELR